MSTTGIIHSVAKATAHRDRDDLDLSVARLLLEFIEARMVAVYRLMDEGGVIHAIPRAVLANEGKDTHDLTSAAKAMMLADVVDWHQCVTQNQVVHSSSAAADRFRSTFPIGTAREIVGLLEIETARPLAPRAATLVDGILRIVKNHLELLDYGERDTLTGLLNRKTFESSFDKLRQRLTSLQRIEPQTEPSWIGIVDVDKFKSINDNYGHLFGDEVLLLLAKLMKLSFRGADHLFRFGGEEFVVVLERATTAGAQVAFERLRAAVEAYSFPQIGRVTISIGYTQVHAQDAPSTCVERADQALYYAKEHGRNAVHSYDVLVASGQLVAKQEGTDIEMF